jgi:hypothetical protein
LLGFLTRKASNTPKLVRISNQFGGILGGRTVRKPNRVITVTIPAGRKEEEQQGFILKNCSTDTKVSYFRKSRIRAIEGLG